MRFDIFTLFPEIFESPLRESILKRAIEAGRLEVALHNIRDWGVGKHQITDDYPYGGGGGMVMKPEPIIRAVEEIKTESPDALPAFSNRSSRSFFINLQCFPTFTAGTFPDWANL